MAHATIILLLLASSTACVPAEPCTEYSIIDYTADQVFEPGTYRIEISYDGSSTACELDTASTPGQSICDDDSEFTAEIAGASLVLLLPDQILETVEVEVRGTETEARWTGVAELELKRRPADLNGDGCSYGSASSTLVVVDP